MKLDEKIKNKFLLSKNLNLFKVIYYLFQKIRSKKKIKKSYSNNHVDLIALELFKHKKKGLYIDVGCNHPFNGNNTYKLYQKGWEGINIDLDFSSIDSFNFHRPKDHNVQIGVSDKNGTQKMYYHHERSAINTLEETRGHRAKEVKEIEISKLDNIIENSKYHNKEIDFISIDVEGYELNVLKGFNFKKYKPKALTIEYIDPTMLKEEFYHQSLDNILSSDVYKLMKDNGYHLVQWLHSDLFFVSSDIFKGIDVS